MTIYVDGSEDNPALNLPPDTIVYVPRKDMKLGSEEWSLNANEAYLNQEEASNHFWFKYPQDNHRIIEMTLLDHFNAFDWDGMNPLWRVDNKKFAKRYNEIHGTSIGPEKGNTLDKTLSSKEGREFLTVLVSSGLGATIADLDDE